MGQFAQDHNLPVENLLSPDYLRRTLWSPPPEPTLEAICHALLELGARQWQVDIAAPIIEEAINRPAPPPAEPAAKPPVHPTAPTEPAAPTTQPGRENH
jgi:ribonuclease D